MWVPWVRDWSPLPWAPRWQPLADQRTWPAAMKAARVWARECGGEAQVDCCVLWDGWGPPWGPSLPAEGADQWAAEQEYEDGAPDPFCEVELCGERRSSR